MIAHPVALIAALLAIVLLACAPAAQPSSPGAGSGSEASRPAPTAAPAKPSEAPAARPAEAPAFRIAPQLADSAVAKAAAKPAQAPAAPPAEKQAARAESLAPGAAAPAPALANAAPVSPDLPIVQNLGRMIIYTTDLTLLVASLNSFPTEAANLAIANGGYLAGVETREESNLPTIVVRLKVPPARYELAMRGLRGLAVEVRGEKATTQDVTEEFSDVQTQITSLEATHAQLLELLKRANTVEETLRIQQQANQIKLQIDRLKGRATALERLSDFATITAKAHAADVAIQREYVTVRAALRRAEATRANLEAQLRRARTPEEEAAIRDKLAEVALEINRHQGRIAELETMASSIKVTLPTTDTAPAVARPDESLPEQYINTRVALRRAEYEQGELTRALREGRPGVDPNELTKRILDVQRLQTQLKSIDERAKQLGIALPTLTPEQEAVLAGIPSPVGGPDLFGSIRGAWDASIEFLTFVGARLLRIVVFLWWTLPLAALAVYLVRRRANALRGAPPAPTL